MANPIKGEIGFTALGQQWVAVFDTNAQCGLEDAFGKGLTAIILDHFEGLGGAVDKDDPEQVRAAARKVEVRVIRAILFHSLRGHHPQIDINLVGKIIDELEMSGAVKLLGDIMTGSLATEDDIGGGTEGNAPNRATRRSVRRS